MVVVAKDDSVQIESMVLGPFGTNAYILSCPTTGDSVVVDAPGEVEKILDGLEGTNPKYILITHNHMDHVGALSELKSTLAVPVGVHAADAGNLSPSSDVLLKDGDMVVFGNIQLKALHTPGHTPGSLCFFIDKYLLSGDTLFPGGPGHTSSPDSLKQIIDSITTKLFPLPKDTRVFPGHGDATILDKERRAFEIFNAKSHDPNLCGDVLWISS